MSLRDQEIGAKLAPHLSSGWDVLDVGSGTGKLSRWLRERTGIRPTLADVADFGNRVGGMPYVRLEDPGTLPFDDVSFDAVLVLFVLHHVARWEDQEALLVEAARVTRKRLILIEDTPLSRTDRIMNTAWDWVLNLRHGVPKPFSFRTVEGWRGVFRRIGLAERSSETYRPLWPTLGTYRHTIFVLDLEGAPESAATAGG
ncbi:MAG: class I SAM-dependent methyltransferase [Actinomycetota bacterium]